VRAAEGLACTAMAEGRSAREGRRLHGWEGLATGADRRLHVLRDATPGHRAGAGPSRAVGRAIRFAAGKATCAISREKRSEPVLTFVVDGIGRKRILVD
jgi:hypothetical protein